MAAPLTPPGCDLSDFPRMMLDIRRLRGSSFDATLDDGAWRAGLNLWMTAWHQVPAASMEDVEAELTKAAGLGRDVKAWRKARAVALRGWVKCDDGRLYHETLAELALEAWIDKLGQRLSSSAGNATRHKLQFDPLPIYDDIKAAAESLRALNPRARSLSKKLVVNAFKDIPPSIPPGDDSLPPGEPEGRKNVPSGSQENGMERKVGRVSKKTLPPDGLATAKNNFIGPKEVRDAFVKAKGEAWTQSYIDPCGWQDVPDRALIPATSTAGRKIVGEGRAVLSTLGLTVLEQRVA